MKTFVTFLFSILFFSNASRGSEISNVTVFSSGAALTRGTGSGNQCKRIFQPLPYALTIRTSSRNLRHFSHQVQLADENNPSRLTEETVRKTLENWLQSGHYSKDQVDELLRLDRSLSPLRTHYISFHHRDIQAGIRIFDGSSRPKSFSSDWPSAAITDNRLPLERRNPDLVLPARLMESGPGRPIQIIELGLLDGPRYFDQVVASAYAQVADFIDANYNQADYSTFQRLEQASSLTIYAVTRDQLVSSQLEQGFHVVMENSSSGLQTPVKTRDGLTLLEMSGSQFIERHFNNSQLPTIREAPYSLPDGFWQARFDQATSRNRIVDELHIQINSIAEANYFIEQAFNEYNATTTLGPLKLDQIFLNYRELVEKLWVVFKSIPVDIKEESIPNWRNLELLLKDLLRIEDPRLGLDLVGKFIELARSQGVHDPNNSSFSFDQDQDWGQ